MSPQSSALELARIAYRPELPAILTDGLARAEWREAKPARRPDAVEIRERFPRSGELAALELTVGAGAGRAGPFRAGVVLSGGQAPGGHNVIAGLFDGLRALHGESRVFGFLGGPKGILTERHRELSAGELQRYRNTGGFDLLGSGRDKIESAEQFAACRVACDKLELDGLVIIGGDDSNTNAALLAERFLEGGSRTAVCGVPKTIDGDLKGGGVEISFGFDTATRVYSELIGNICRDARSARKYWHFIRLMGRSASHVTLECALQTHPNVALIAEEVERDGRTLSQIVQGVAEVVRRRAEAGQGYGVLLVPEGLIEFIPEMRSLIRELNGALSEHASAVEALSGLSEKVGFVRARLTAASADVFDSLPERIRQQLVIDRDAHGNVQVSKIDTEQLLIEQVSLRIRQWQAAGRFPGKFLVQGHFFGYEGRCAPPTNFDAAYTSALGRLAAKLVASGKTGYICSVANLAAAPEAWIPRAIPLAAMMRIETRHGKPTPVIAKALTRLDAEPFRTFAELRPRLERDDDYLYPGPIQYFGPAEVTSVPCRSLVLEYPAGRGR